jgi:ribose-phosphate pyrophosphokinase
MIRQQERRPTQSHDRQNANLLLVGHVANRTAILIDDLADTSNTITRAAKLLKKSGAHTVYALVTHGVFSGDACERINQSALDKVVCTNSVPQEENERKCRKLEVLEVGKVFAEAIRRVHHGESISVLFQYD